jgi:hypothetical protein
LYNFNAGLSSAWLITVDHPPSPPHDIPIFTSSLLI